MILMTTAKAVVPNLVQELQTATENADRLGITGATMFQCHNYTSPIHGDNDGSHGLCAQYLLEAKRKEYAFCHLVYRTFVESQSNCLWSVFNQIYLNLLLT
jgi:hypothetical protein